MLQGHKKGRRIPGYNIFTPQKVYDTSPYAYSGVPHNGDPYLFSYAGIDDPYSIGVEQFTNDEVKDFESDSIFGLGNKKKQAERKLRRAERQLAKGHYKRAARLESKAQNLLGHISAGQQAELAATQNLADVNTTQGTIAQSLANADQAGNLPVTATNPLSTQPMSQVGQQNIPGAGGSGEMDMTGTSDLTGVESVAPDTSQNDIPTGDLAATKTLSDVTVKSTVKGINPIIIIVVAVLIIVAIVYFSKGKGKGKKLF